MTEPELAPDQERDPSEYRPGETPDTARIEAPDVDSPDEERPSEPADEAEQAPEIGLETPVDDTLEQSHAVPEDPDDYR
ncbi:hypothetical protein [Actinocatenispora thailandica]|uniref:hypothetical protein n=1 Tax=Actinocatenispora thailandica TaxID=227318 RepID=UPI00194F5279|nr:hypothetical protein [Actinocatenispora thailandica]